MDAKTLTAIAGVAVGTLGSESAPGIYATSLAEAAALLVVGPEPD